VNKQINQEELAFGVCSVSTLSRIENNTQHPSRAVYEKLMQRMGLSPEIFPSFYSERELDLFQLKHRINQALIKEQYNKAERLTNKMQQAKSLEPIYKQLVKYVDAIISFQKGDNPVQTAKAMHRVVSMSIKDCSADKLLSQIFTLDELSMLRMLALTQYQAGKHNDGIDLLYGLKDYIERKVVDNKGVSPMYTLILHTLSSWVGMQGNIDEALKLCEIGLQRCVEYGAYFSFAGLLYNKGYSLVKLRRDDEARKYLQEAFYFARAQGNQTYVEHIANFATTNGIEL